MLVNLKAILEEAEAGKYAVGAFNTPNLESVIAVLQVAERLRLPVVIQHAEVHEKVIPISVIGPIMVDFAAKASVPVCVQLDHGESEDYIRKALELGFTGIMYDGSSLPFDENVRGTRKYVELARRYGASVEGELGDMGKRNTVYKDAKGNDELGKVYTDPDQAREFVKQTGVDALACSFGTTHGFYLSEPDLRMDIISQVYERAGIPVVMHGGSGVSEEDFQESIRCGVRKINYYTYMAKAGAEYVGEKMRGVATPIYFHEICNWGQEGIERDVEQAVKIFAGNYLEQKDGRIDGNIKEEAAL